MKLTFTGNQYEVQCRFEEKDLVKKTGRWSWNGERKIWSTPWTATACFLYMFADETCKERLENEFSKISEEMKSIHALTEEELGSLQKVVVPESTLTREQIDSIHLALKRLTGVCDGAYQRDYSGFNANDADFGHQLAFRESLTIKQAQAGYKMLRKYHRQIPQDIYVTIYGKPYTPVDKPKKDKKYEKRENQNLSLG
jgi:hypothetical protein